jgi:hypothetical protein
MVTVTENMDIAGDPNLTVYSPTGDYADTDLILCADKKNPGLPIVQLQAQYLRYGPIVYQYNAPEELGGALFALDPDSTHDAVLLYKEEEARKAARMGGTLIPSDPVPSPDSNADASPIPEAEEEDVKFFKEQDAQGTATSTPEVPTTDPEIPVIDAGETLGVSTSTDSAIPVPEPEIPTIQLETSTTTPVMQPEVPSVSVPDTTATTTPE